MLSLFNEIIAQDTSFPGHERVKVQVIQTISILVQNVKHDTSLFYLMSNNHINELLQMDLTFVDGGDLLAQYVSLLKLVSLKLNPSTIQFFFNEGRRPGKKEIQFPLYTEALRFFDHSDNMVRIATRTLTLNVYRVEDKALRRFIGSNEHLRHFVRVYQRLGQHWERIDRVLLRIEAGTTASSSSDDENTGALEAELQEEIEEHRDFLFYLQDVIAIQIDGFQESLLNMFRKRLLMPIVRTLVQSSANQAIIPMNLDDSAFRELPLSVQEEREEKWRQEYLRNVRQRAREKCQMSRARKLTPRELMLPVTLSRLDKQRQMADDEDSKRIEILKERYKVAKRAYYTSQVTEGDDNETLKRAALEAKRLWIEAQEKEENTLSIGKSTEGTALCLSPRASPAMHRARRISLPLLSNGSNDDSATDESNHENNDPTRDLGVLVVLVLLTDIFRTVTHQAILNAAVSALLGSKAWPNIMKMLRCPDDRVVVCTICMLDAIFESGYPIGLLTAGSSDTTQELNTQDDRHSDASRRTKVKSPINSPATTYSVAGTVARGDVVHVYPGVARVLQLCVAEKVPRPFPERGCDLITQLVRMLTHSSPRPLTIMHATSTLMMKLLRDALRSPTTPLSSRICSETAADLRNGHVTITLRLLAMIRHEKAEHQLYDSELRSQLKRGVNRSARSTRESVALSIIEEQHSAMVRSPPSIRLILNRIRVLTPSSELTAESSSSSGEDAAQRAPSTISGVTKIRQTIQQWLITRRLIRDLWAASNDREKAEVDSLSLIIASRPLLNVGQKLEIRRTTPYMECKLRLPNTKSRPRMWLIVGKRWILLVEPESDRNSKRSSSNSPATRPRGIARAIIRVHHCNAVMGSPSKRTQSDPRTLHLICRSRSKIKCAKLVSNPKVEQNAHLLRRDRVGGLGPTPVWEISLMFNSAKECLHIKDEIDMNSSALQMQFLVKIEEILTASIRNG